MIRTALFSLLFLAACSEASSALITSEQIQGDAIPTPLTQVAGDAQRGQVIFSSRDSGHCVLCHVIAGLDVSFQGNVGPDLTHVADRLTPAQLRLRIVDYQLVREGALMPSYYRNHDLYQVADAYSEQSILTAQEVEDVIAYLSELKTHEDD